MRVMLDRARSALMTCPQTGEPMSPGRVFVGLMLAAVAIAVPPVIAIVLGGML